MTNRIEKLQKLLRGAQLDAAVLNPGASLRYLTGLDFHLMERPVVFVLPAEGQAKIIMPRLEAPKLEVLTFECQTCLYGDDPATWQEVFNIALAEMRGYALKIGVEATRLRFLELNFLENALDEAEFVNAGEVFANLRMVKDENELRKMRKAAEIAEAALISTIRTIKAGQSEKEIAAELLVQLYHHGSDQELPFAPIVCSGPNSANPHASPSSRIVNNGDLILFDWGAAFDGYLSDITRCFYLGKINPQMIEIAETVQRANHNAVFQVRPGLKAGEVDGFARQVITESGYGEYFTHRTGHGLGMEAHEAPYIFAGNSLVLEEGMVFTVEPGIYVPGLGGIRIEDDIVVTADGFKSLSSLPREVKTIDDYLKIYDIIRNQYEIGL